MSRGPRLSPVSLTQLPRWAAHARPAPREESLRQTGTSEDILERIGPTGPPPLPWRRHRVCGWFGLRPPIRVEPALGRALFTSCLDAEESPLRFRLSPSSSHAMAYVESACPRRNRSCTGSPGDRGLNSMTHSLVPHRWRSPVPQNRRSWLRRAVLLSSIATSLVLVGDHGLTGALGQAAVQVPSQPSTLQANVVSFTRVAVSVHQSIGTMSEWAFEVVSLFLLGLCLLGGGRALTRKARRPDDSHVAVSRAAAPPELVCVAKRA
jgi:hypothetical protein